MWTHRGHQQGESNWGIEPMPLQHSHLHHPPPANHNLKESSNRRSIWSAFHEAGHNNTQQSGSQEKGKFRHLLSALPTWQRLPCKPCSKEGGNCHDQSDFNLRPCPPHYQARVPAQWCRTWMVKLQWTREPEINITCWGEGLRNRTCSVSFYVPWMPATIFWGRIMDDNSDHGIALCTQAWVKEQKRSRWESTVYGYKERVLRVFTCIDGF